MLQINPPRAPREVPDLWSRAHDLHERERELVDTLGKALLHGWSADAAREELRRIRDDLEALYAAARLLERTPFDRGL